MGLLDSFASGLRNVGYMSPEVGPGLMAQDTNRANQQSQLQNLMLLQKIKAAESGASAPFEMPGVGMVGPDVDAQKKIEDVANRRKISAEVGQLAPEDRANPLKLADIFMRNGDHATGAKYIDSFESRQARIQTAKDALDGKLMQLQMMENNQNLNREQKAQIAEQTLELRRQGQAFAAQIASGNQDLKRLGIEQRGDAAKAGQEQKAAQQSQKQVTQLGAALEKANLPVADATLAAAEQALEKTPNLHEYIGGVGKLKPDWSVSNDVAAGRQAFQKLFNITLKDRSGAAVTPPEFERLKQEFGNGVFKTPEQIKNALTQARTIINKHYAGVAAGFPKEALDEYNNTVRGYGGNVVIGGKQDVTKISGDADYAKLPSGATFIAPDGTTRTKP